MPPADLGILHLSDLHFGPYLQQTEPHGEWANIRGAYPHHYRLVQGMEIQVALLLRAFKGRVVAAVTGDMTTAGEPSAYEVVNNYLRGRTYVRGLEQVGLGLSANNIPLFCVPGNHDYWHSAGKTLSKWRYKNRHEVYQKYFSDALPDVYPVYENGLSLAVYCLDSNRLTKHRLPWQLENMLGSGEIGDDQLADLHTKHVALVDGTRPRIPEGFKFAESLRVLLLHHHLTLPPEVDPQSAEQRRLVLRDVNKVKAMIRDYRIHMVLCGHQHFPHLVTHLDVGDPNRSVFYACAGSATQTMCDKNSFFFYELRRAGPTALDVTAVEYVRADPDSFSFWPTRHPDARIELG